MARFITTSLLILAFANSIAFAQSEKEFVSFSTKYFQEVKKCGTGSINVILIGCFSCRWNVWMEFMLQNKNNYTMYAPTVPGFGGSLYPILETTSSGTAYRDNLIKGLSGLIDSLKLNNVVLIGHSWGTQPVLQLAIQKKDKIKSIIVLDGKIESDSWLPKTEKERLEMSERMYFYYDSLFADPEQWKMFNGYSFPPGSDSISTKEARFALRLHGSFMATPKNVLLQYWRENYFVDITAVTKQIKVPVLDIKCLQGKGQDSLRVVNDNQLKNAGIPSNVKSIYFYNTSHFLMFYRQKELNSSIYDFLNQTNAFDIKFSNYRELIKK